MSASLSGEGNPHQPPFLTRLALLLLSAAVLTFEINLTRLFSVAQFYHFAFMIISLALLGFGASGAFLTLFPVKDHREVLHRLPALALATGLATLGAYMLINRLPFDSFSIAWDNRQWLILVLHYLALSLPFFFTGLAVGSLLSAYQAAAGQVYAVNLIGSAIGCMLALVAPALLGGEGTVVLSVALAAVAAATGYPAIGNQRDSLRRLDKSVALGAAVLFIYSSALLWPGSNLKKLTPGLDLHISPYKGLSYALQYPDAELLTQEWNAFSRVDVVSSSGVRSLPGMSYRYPHLPPGQLGLLVDGDDLSPIVLPDANLDFAGYMPSALPFRLRPGADALILEPRGGLDLLVGLAGGADTLTAVEPNALIVAQAEHVYGQPGVQVVVENGRSYLRRTRHNFDVVIISLASAYHPVRSGAYSLTEDYRYTVEGFQDALARLNPGGIVFVARWLQVPPSEWLRSFGMMVTALEGEGLDPAARIVAFRGYNMGFLLVKRAPYTEEEMKTVRAFTIARAFDLVYAPDIRFDEVNQFNVLEEPIYYQTFTELLSAPSHDEWYAAYPFDVTPATDNHPFFNHYFKWSQAGQVLTEFGKVWQPFGGAGYFVLLVLLVLALLMAFTLIVAPIVVAQLRKCRRDIRMPIREVWPALSYFGFIGLGFLFIEIPLIQQVILFLGHPAYAVTAVLFAVLFFSGIGSHFAHRLGHRTALAMLVALILASSWLLEPLFNLGLGFLLAGRVSMVLVALAPLGFLMGMPFPNGILGLDSARQRLVPWAWGVNGAVSVVSSVLAAVLAISFGLQPVLIIGAACYAAAWWAAPRLAAPQAIPPRPPQARQRKRLPD